MATLKSRLPQIAKDTEPAAQRALLQTAADILDVAKQLVPKDTTSLMRSGGVNVIDSSNVEVGFGAEGVFIDGREPSKYAAIVEYGSSLQPAQPYLTPAFVQSDETFRVRLAEEVKKAVG